MAFSQISPENGMMDLICILVLTHMHTQKHTPPTTHHRHRAYTLHIHTTYARTVCIHTTRTEAPTAITLSPKFRVCTQTPALRSRHGFSMSSTQWRAVSLELAMLFSAVWSPQRLSILICSFGFYFLSFSSSFLFRHIQREWVVLRYPVPCVCFGFTVTVRKASFSLTVCRLPLLLGPVVLQREAPWLCLCATVCMYARKGECVCFSRADSKCVLA